MLKTNIIFYLFILIYINASAQDGMLDHTFGTYGIATIDISGYYEVAGDAKVQNDGKIIIVGSTYKNNKTQGLLLRLKPNGEIDSTFADEGIRYINQIGSTELKLNSAALLPDDFIIAGGYSVEPGETFAILVKCSSDGTIDTSFGTDGIVKIFSGKYSNDAYVSDIMLQPDGKIIFCGKEKSDHTEFLEQFVIGRFLPEGIPDSSFGGEGLVYNYLTGLPSYATSITMQADGKIIAAGITGHDFALTRYLNNGVPDYDFGTMGIVTTSFDDYDYLEDIGVMHNGNIVAVGYYYDFSNNNCEYWKSKILVACYTPTGELNEDFNSDGITTFAINHCNDEAYSLLIQPDDKILIGGATGNLSALESFNYSVLRLNPDGSKDNSFADDGYLETDMYLPNEYYAYPQSLEFQPDGKAVLAGYTNDWDHSKTFFSAIRISTGVDSVDLIEQDSIAPPDNRSGIWSSNKTLFIYNTTTAPIEVKLFSISGAHIYTFVAPSGISEYNMYDLSKGIYVVNANSVFLKPVKIFIGQSNY